MAEQERYIVWIDAGGRTRATIPSANPNSTAIMAALANHSNAGVLSWFEGPRISLSPTPVSATFADVVDLARLVFTTPGGSTATLALPAPKANIFLADTVTVDPTTIPDILAACIGTLTAAGGIPVTAFVAGVRNQRSSGA